MSKVIFSGIQPSGNLHIGNYIGAISQWVKLQNETESIFCIVDLHAITVYQDPKVLREKVLEVTALYLAAGIDPKKAHIFVQSENLNHTYLAWILDCNLSMGQLFRMTQFKEKAQKLMSLDKTLSAAEEARALFEGSVGLFNYPALMAADILLYDTDMVPVGEDQKQHIELTRDVAEKFNKTYGEVFKLPEPVIQKETARIMSLQNPNAKMSKSDVDSLGTINLLDTADAVWEKVKRAVTDSGSEIVFGEDKPAISNLLTIYSVVSKESPIEAENSFRGKGYGDFKNDLAEALVSFLAPIQEKYNQIRQDKEYLNKVLDEGRDFSISKSSQKVKKVNEAMGLGRE